MVKALFDHNMPPSIAKALDVIVSVEGHRAIALKDKFQIDIKDEEFFFELGKEDDWVVISKDVRNAKRGPEREAILRSGVLAFYLAPSIQKLRISEQAATILWQWEKIVTQRKSTANGLFQIPIGRNSKFRSL